MQRRRVLKSVAALPLLALPQLRLAASDDRASPPRRRVRPSDAAWPAAVEWRQLSDAIGGNLLEVHALCSACATDPEGPACREVVDNIGNPFYIGDHPGGT